MKQIYIYLTSVTNSVRDTEHLCSGWPPIRCVLTVGRMRCGWDFNIITLYVIICHVESAVMTVISIGGSKTV
jgi:hypothetical protein